VDDVAPADQVPEGPTAEDRARPVILARDFETGRAEYEIYTFNRQVVTVPLGSDEGGDRGPGSESGVDRIAKQEIEREIRSIAQGYVEVELRGSDRAVVWVEEGDISGVIGKGGGRISDVEGRLGIDLDVRTFAERDAGSSSDPGSGSGSRPAGGSSHGGGTAGKTVSPDVTSRHVVIPLEGHAGETVEVQADCEYLFTATVSRGGEIQVSRGSAIAEELEAAIDHGRMITVVPS
jgi:ATPase